MIRIAIVEDEDIIIETIKQIIHEYCPETEIVGTASEMQSAIGLLQHTKIDLALLDISISGGNIFDVLKQLENVTFKIIFITAHEEYALQAIKFSAFDYLLKPIDPLELIKSIHEATRIIEKENADIQLSTLMNNLVASNPCAQTLVLKTAESIHFVGIHEIIRCESDNSYTTFYLNSGKKIIVSKAIKEYDTLLSSSAFCRVHQSHLVNLNQIERYEKKDGGYLVMKDSSTVPVSYRKKETLLKTFEKMTGH